MLSNINQLSAISFVPEPSASTGLLAALATLTALAHRRKWK